MRFRPRVLPLSGTPDAGELLARLRSRRGLALLDSAGGAPREWSLVGFDPLRGIALPGDIAGLRESLAPLAVEEGDPVPGPFHGGFLGAFAYDLGVAGERRPEVARDPWNSPRVAGGIYVDFIVRDERTARVWLVLGEDPGDGRADLASRERSILELLGRPAPRAAVRATGPLVRRTAPEEHRARIESARERIAAGDFYQANLAHRFTREMEGDPIDLYRRLREVNPAPYAGYLAFEGGAILSSSPELLLEFDGRLARTKPIKGTARRRPEPAADAEAARALLASAKDRAELAMIVDLERNDLGRVSRAGSVEVAAFPRLETYASVHHLVAEVVAHPRPGADAVDLLAALFPGGSITGAPKLAAMDAIAELEGEGRGFFTGSLGFADLRGRACFNILIRTLFWRPGEVSFHVGGGITWSSDPRAEDEETLAKAASLAAALEVDGEVGARTGKKHDISASESVPARSRSGDWGAPTL